MPQRCEDERVTRAPYQRSWQSEYFLRTKHSQQVIHAWF
jgi:hypothetical protein